MSRLPADVYSDAWQWWTALLRKHRHAPPLNVAQGAMLETFHRHDTPYGALGSLGVGSGKTLLLFLLTTIAPERRVVALVPPGLDREMLRQKAIWEPHYHLRMPHVVTYSQLSQPKNARLLDELAPDLILVDECHMLRHETSARTKRFMRYMSRHAGRPLKSGQVLPLCRTVLMSGTITDGDLDHYQHLLFLALRDKSPGPLPPAEVARWASVIDPAGEPTRHDILDLEPLRKWSGEVDWEIAYYKRMSSAPGVVCTSGTSTNCSIHLRMIRLPVPQAIQEALNRLGDEWELPDGSLISEASEYARHAKSLSVGFYYDLDDPPSEEWAIARRVWGRELRTLLAYRSRTGFDSPAVIEAELRRSTFEGYAKARASLQEWDKYRHLERAPHRTVWLDQQYLLDAVASWAKKNPHSIVWYQTDAVGTLLKEAGYDVRGAGDEPPTDEPLVALQLTRFQAGFNLQYQHTALYLEPPTSGSAWDQSIGRMHRQGQKSDVVNVCTLASTYMQRRSINKALAKALSMQKKTGQPHRLLLASKEWSDDI